MNYLPPPTWPPPDDWPLPNDDWRPPYGWRPRSGHRISPDGSAYLLRPAPGREAAPALDEPSAVEVAQFKRAVATRMVALWAATVMSSAHSYYQAAMKAAWTDRAIEHGEDWSPRVEDLAIALDQVWVRGYQLVNATYQMERWRLAYEGNDAEPIDEALRALRNSLEHLDGAHFSEYSARKGSGKNSAHSIDYLPGQELFLGFQASFTTDAFGVVNLEQITKKARLYLYVNEPPEEDWSEYTDGSGGDRG